MHLSVMKWGILAASVYRAGQARRLDVQHDGRTVAVDKARPPRLLHRGELRREGVADKDERMRRKRTRRGEPRFHRRPRVPARMLALRRRKRADARADP